MMVQQALALVCLIVFPFSELTAQTRPANESELDTIREAFTLDEVPPSKNEVLELRGTFFDATETSPARLIGLVYLQPYVLEPDLCVMEMWYRASVQQLDKYQWDPRMVSYAIWLRKSGDPCRISVLSDLPPDAIRTNDAIPPAALSFVLNKAGQILALAFQYAAESLEMSPLTREQFLRYRNDPLFRLAKISIPRQRVQNNEFELEARFRSPRKTEGPLVIFSVAEASIVVDGVGSWSE
jgi:hypothetical protein